MEIKSSIPGIDCSVDNCMYHTTEDKCTAGSIKVGAQKACCSSCDTECVTFKPCN